MKLLTNIIKTHIPIFSLILSIIAAWMIFPMVTGFPMVAFAFLFAGLGFLIYVVKTDRLWVDTILYCGVLSLSFFTICRANEFLQFFDFILIIFFISVLVRPLSNVYDIFHLLLSPLTVFFNTFASENIFKYTFTLPAFMKQKNYVKEYTTTIIVTVIIMFITIPLLSSANPLFSNLLQKTLELFNLGWLWRIFITDSAAIYILRMVAILFFAYMIPRSLSVTLKGIKEYATFPLFSINYLIPKIVMFGTLLVFFFTQLQLYFATPELLQSLGYTNSKLTNEVFAQVTVVAFIVLLLTYLDTSRKKWNSRLTYFLLLQALFLIGIAFKSVFDYSWLYGFTQKRLWGYASMTWLTGALGFYIYHFYKETSVNAFIKNMLAFSVVVVFTINFLNFDYVIYHIAKPSTQAGIDYGYISYLSVDGHYYNELLPQLVKDIESAKTLDDAKIQPALRIIRGIEHLRYKYERNDINSFNFTEYQEYQATKKTDIEAYKNIISEKKQKMSPDMSPKPAPTR